MSQSVPGAAMPALNPSSSRVDYYLRFGVAGAICAATNHLLLVPLDVVKTRIQLNPSLYKSPVEAGKAIFKSDGLRGLYLGVVPTGIGYVLRFLCK